MGLLLSHVLTILIKSTCVTGKKKKKKKSVVCLAAVLPGCIYVFQAESALGVFQKLTHPLWHFTSAFIYLFIFSDHKLYKNHLSHFIFWKQIKRNRSFFTWKNKKRSDICHLYNIAKTFFTPSVRTCGKLESKQFLLKISLSLAGNQKTPYLPLVVP